MKSFVSTHERITKSKRSPLPVVKFSIWSFMNDSSSQMKSHVFLQGVVCKSYQLRVNSYKLLCVWELWGENEDFC